MFTGGIVNFDARSWLSTSCEIPYRHALSYFLCNILYLYLCSRRALVQKYQHESKYREHRARQILIRPHAGDVARGQRNLQQFIMGVTSARTSSGVAFILPQLGNFLDLSGILTIMFTYKTGLQHA